MLNVICLTAIMDLLLSNCLLSITMVYRKDEVIRYLCTQSTADFHIMECAKLNAPSAAADDTASILDPFGLNHNSCY
jgi:hypothetical protein